MCLCLQVAFNIAAISIPIAFPCNSPLIRSLQAKGTEAEATAREASSASPLSHPPQASPPTSRAPSSSSTTSPSSVPRPRPPAPSTGTSSISSEGSRSSSTLENPDEEGPVRTRQMRQGGGGELGGYTQMDWLKVPPPHTARTC